MLFGLRAPQTHLGTNTSIALALAPGADELPSPLLEFDLFVDLAAEFHLGPPSRLDTFKAKT